MKRLIAMLICLFLAQAIFAQSLTIGKYELEANQVLLDEVKMSGKHVVRVVKDSTVQKVDEPTFAKLIGTNFKNGIIKVKVLSRLLSTAPDYARGFIGIAYRIQEGNAAYESVYLRPTNARAEDQVRRNHSIQYYAYPNHKFDKLRKEAPEQYESYTDMELGKWISIKLEVTNDKAKLYLDNRDQPSLSITLPKNVTPVAGHIGLWVDIGTEGFFKDLEISHHNW